MIRWSAGILGMLLIASCGSVPFKKVSYVSLDGVEPLAMVDNYEKSLPEHFQILNTVLFKYGWNKFSTIGYIDINIRAKTFAVASMNPMGLKLFELAGNNDSVDTMFMMEEFGRRGDLAGAVGKDIRRIYFNLVPSATAEIKKKQYQALFRQQTGAGSLVYVFAGAEGYLIKKKYYEDNKLDWSVSYYEYRQKDGKIYPGGIVLKNYKYGYSLTVKLKEIRG